MQCLYMWDGWARDYASLRKCQRMRISVRWRRAYQENRPRLTLEASSLRQLSLRDHGSTVCCSVDVVASHTGGASLPSCAVCLPMLRGIPLPARQLAARSEGNPGVCDLAIQLEDVQLDGNYNAGNVHRLQQ